jgi:hypothetical protein
MRFGGSDDVLMAKTSMLACVSNVAKPSQFGTGSQQPPSVGVEP